MASSATLGQIVGITQKYVTTVYGLNNLIVKPIKHALDLIQASGRTLSPKWEKIHGDLGVLKNALALSELAENLIKVSQQIYGLRPQEKGASGRLWNLFSTAVETAASGLEALEAAKARDWVRLDAKTEKVLQIVETAAAIFMGLAYIVQDLMTDHSEARYKAERGKLAQSFENKKEAALDKDLAEDSEHKIVSFEVLDYQKEEALKAFDEQRKVSEAMRMPLLGLYGSVALIGGAAALSMMKYKLPLLTFPLLSLAIHVHSVALPYRAGLANNGKN